MINFLFVASGNINLASGYWLQQKTKNNTLIITLLKKLKALLVNNDMQDVNFQELANHRQKLDKWSRAILASSPQATLFWVTDYLNFLTCCILTSIQTCTDSQLYWSLSLGKLRSFLAKQTKLCWPLTKGEK